MSRASVDDPDLSDPTVRKTKLFPSHTEQLQNVIFPFSLLPVLLYLFGLCSVPLPGCRIKSKEFKSPDLLFSFDLWIMSFGWSHCIGLAVIRFLCVCLSVVSLSCGKCLWWQAGVFIELRPSYRSGVSEASRLLWYPCVILLNSIASCTKTVLSYPFGLGNYA